MTSTVEQWLERTLAAAPPLSTEQRTRLAELLRPARQTMGRELMAQAGRRTAGQRLRQRLRRSA